MSEAYRYNLEIRLAMTQQQLASSSNEAIQDQLNERLEEIMKELNNCLLYTSPSPRDS